MCSECGSDPQHIPEGALDPKFRTLLKPWDEMGHQARRVGGWHFFSDHALEAEVLMLLDRMMRHMVKTRPDLVVVETGVGQGYTTRYLAHHLRPDHDLYWCYESDDDWRMNLSLKDFWLDNLSVCLKDYPMPEPREMAIADLVIIHSSRPWNLAELHLWEACSKPDSVLLFTGTLPDVLAPTLTLGNPRGSHVIAWDMARPSQIWSTLFERKWVAG